jgi:hypothetical protein
MEAITRKIRCLMMKKLKPCNRQQEMEAEVLFHLGEHVSVLIRGSLILMEKISSVPQSHGNLQ